MMNNTEILEQMREYSKLITLNLENEFKDIESKIEAEKDLKQKELMQQYYSRLKTTIVKKDTGDVTAIITELKSFLNVG
jgi:hypothetical protein